MPTQVKTPIAQSFAGQTCTKNESILTRKEKLRTFLSQLQKYVHGQIKSYRWWKFYFSELLNPNLSGITSASPSLGVCKIPQNPPRRGALTWRNCRWSSARASRSSSASRLFCSATSLWMVSRRCCAWLTTCFCWALISSRTSKRFNSTQRTRSLKTLLLVSAASRAECCGGGGGGEEEEERCHLWHLSGKKAREKKRECLRLTLREKIVCLSFWAAFSCCWILCWELSFLSASCLCGPGKLFWKKGHRFPTVPTLGWMNEWMIWLGGYFRFKGDFFFLRHPPFISNEHFNSLMLLSVVWEKKWLKKYIYIHTYTF